MEFKMNSFIFFGGDFGVHVSSLFNMNSPKSPAPFPRLHSSQHCRPRGAGAVGEGLSQGAHQAQPGCDACDAWWLGDDSFDFVWGLYYLLSHNIYIYIYYIIHSNNDNNDDHIMMVINNNNNNKVIYIYTYEYIGDYHSPGNHALDQPVDCGMTEVPNTQPGSSWPACDGGPCSIMQPFPTTKLLIKPQFLHWLPDPVARWIMGRNTGLTNKHYVMDIFFWLVNHWITIKVLSRFWHHPGGFGECWMDLDGL